MKRDGRRWSGLTYRLDYRYDDDTLSRNLYVIKFWFTFMQVLVQETDNKQPTNQISRFSSTAFNFLARNRTHQCSVRFEKLVQENAHEPRQTWKLLVMQVDLYKIPLQVSWLCVIVIRFDTTLYFSDFFLPMISDSFKFSICVANYYRFLV